MYTQIHNISKTSDRDDLINNLLSEIQTLRKECESKNDIIQALSTSNGNVSIGSDWKTIEQSGRKPNKTQKSADQLHLQNRFGSLACPSNDQQECNERCCFVDSQVQVDHSKTSPINRQSRRPENVIDQHPESNRKLSWRESRKWSVPGNASYSDVSKSGRKVFLLGDSMVKRILGGNISRRLTKGRAFVRSYVGATCEEIAYHGIPDLSKGNVDILVLTMGQNNVGRRYDRDGSEINETAEEIAEKMIDVTKKLRDAYAINNVFLCTLTPRKEDGLNNKVREINLLLRSKVKDSGIDLIEQENITEKHLYDKVHLDSVGLNILEDNIVNKINKCM